MAQHNNNPGMRFVRMIENAKAASIHNPSAPLEYEAGQVYQIDASTAQSFKSRGYVQTGRVIETIVSDENGTETVGFEFIPDGEEPAADPPAVVQATAKPVQVEIIAAKPVPQPETPVGAPPPSTEPVTQDATDNTAGEDQPAENQSRKQRRGKFTAQPDQPK